MDVETGAILALQILALCSIVAALLAYLMRQSRNASDEYESRNKRHVLVTSCDTCVGLQIALALYEGGYKVIVVALSRPTRQWISERGKSNGIGAHVAGYFMETILLSLAQILIML